MPAKSLSFRVIWFDKVAITSVKAELMPKIFLFFEAIVKRRLLQDDQGLYRIRNLQVRF